MVMANAPVFLDAYPISTKAVLTQAPTPTESKIFKVYKYVDQSLLEESAKLIETLRNENLQLKRKSQARKQGIVESGTAKDTSQPPSSTVAKATPIVSVLSSPNSCVHIFDKEEKERETATEGHSVCFCEMKHAYVRERETRRLYENALRTVLKAGIHTYDQNPTEQSGCDVEVLRQLLIEIAKAAPHYCGEF